MGAEAREATSSEEQSTLEEAKKKVETAMYACSAALNQGAGETENKEKEQ
eukprot:NODE_6837_length_305_cov_321.250000_g5678_i0.p1 GENE.NODE_6837_length_305_cov_321.250000_g5678_i0~~NODE_6837_length_305_cov_321.250000_g5678_i0.p1  ORF type:complete len:50 (+),score=19.60 NODE_6837_length_305_cov_321.250000_g5678_i0:30-179(+)